MKILLQILLFTSFMMADTQTIAISYFDNTSGLEEYNPLSKGLADMLITDLSNVKSVQIVEREKLESLLKEIELGESKFMDESTAQKLGKGLGASYMLTGSYLIMGETMRIDARLVNVATGEVSMGEEITGEKNTFFELEKDLVEKLISALNLSLSKSEERRVKKVQTESFDSFNAYSASLDSYDKGEYEESQKFLEKAVEIDTDFDVAWDKLDALQEELEQLLAARSIKLSTEIIKIMDDLVNNDKESCETFINMYDNITSRISWHLWSENQYEGSLYDKQHKEDISNSFSKLMKIYKYIGTKNYQIDICEDITSSKDRGAFQRGSSNQFEKMWDNSYLLEDFLVNIIFFEAKTSDSLMVNDLDNNNRNIKNVIDEMIIYFGQKLIKSFPNRDKYSSDKTLMYVERAIYRKKHPGVYTAYSWQAIHQPDRLEDFFKRRMGYQKESVYDIMYQVDKIEYLRDNYKTPTMSYSELQQEKLKREAVEAMSRTAADYGRLEKERNEREKGNDLFYSDLINEPGESFSIGPNNAEATIIAWIDLQKESDSKIVPLFQILLKKYPENLRIIIKNHRKPWHKSAKKAALYTLAAHRQDKYFELINKIFSNYKRLVSDQDLPYQYAEELEINMDKLDRDMKDPLLISTLENETIQLANLKDRNMIDGTILINRNSPHDYGIYSYKRDSFEREIDTYSMIINKLIRDNSGNKKLD